ncbi:MAG: hypothetical protein U0Q16_15360 [Bryobacteraceae bacterium]
MRLRLVHWNETEARELAGRIRGKGIQVEVAPISGKEVIRTIREDPPDVVVISLDRLPSHGREVAAALRMTKATRHVPIVFAGGEPEKVAKVRERLPDAGFAGWDNLHEVARICFKQAPAAPVVPKSKSGFDSGTPLFRKLGIGEGTKVALLGAPPEHEGRFAEHVTRGKDPDMTLWFLRSGREFESELHYVLDAARVLWIFWPKKTAKTNIGVTQFSLRHACAERGWTDSKICAVDATWSGMRFTPRRAPRTPP